MRIDEAIAHLSDERSKRPTMAANSVIHVALSSFATPRRHRQLIVLR